MLKGSCLCGGVQYEISGDMSDVVHCHCPTCRKTHATAFSSVSSVASKDFKMLSGEHLLKSFESSLGKRRYFCSHCGSHIYAHRDGHIHYIFRLGTLDEDPKLKPAHHIWLSKKAPWYDIEADSKLPQFQTWAE